MSPVKFLFTFLFITIALWLVFLLVSRLVALILSKVLKASVEFKLCGWRCLRNVRITFQRGSIESVSLGEIKLSLKQSLAKLGVGLISRDPKLQMVIRDLEIVTRTPDKSTKKPRKPKSSGSGKCKGKGKFMLVANMARFLAVSLTDLTVKTPKATLEIKDLGLDISKDRGSKPSMYLKLQLSPIIIHLGELQVSDKSSSSNGSESLSADAGSMIEKSSAHFMCEEFGFSVEFGPNKETGITLKNIDISFGDMSLDLNEELLNKKRKSSDSHADEVATPTTESDIAKKQEKKQAQLSAITKYTALFPEKVYLILPKFNVKFVHNEHRIVIENNITGIQFKSIKSRSAEDVGESTRIDLQLDFNEIHLLKEGESSILDIQKLAVVSFVYVPLEPTMPIKSETDIKLGGIQCNIILARLKPLMQLRPPKKKTMVLKDESANPVKVKSSDGSKVIILWTCTFSAPETTIAIFNLDGLQIYHVCLQSSHVFANNSYTTGIAVHSEIGDLSLHISDEHQESPKESSSVVETNTGSLLHITKVNLDFGKKDLDSLQQDSPNLKLVLSVNITGIDVCLTLKRIQFLLSTALLFKSLLKTSSPSVKTPAQSQASRATCPNKPSGKGVQLIKFNLERCSVNLCSDVSLDDEDVDDPKRVNYGSQGGHVLITNLPDGTLRTAKVSSTTSDELKIIKYSLGLEINNISLNLNKEKQSTQVELERARSVYQEILEDDDSGTKVALFDIQKAKFVKRVGGLKEVSICSLFSATSITARWEPDVHLALVELGLRLKLLLHNQKLQAQEDEPTKEKHNEVKKEDKKKKENLFAIDVEMLTVTAEAGDGVEAVIQVQSIFSENARIGVLLEGLMLSFNAAKVFKSGRMQISRIPNASEPAVKWDWVIQGLDMHICMPFKLQLRALDDSIEEMLRALKLVAAAKTKLIFPFKKESSSASTKPKKPSSSKLGRVKLYMRKITAEIEEEPLQGWLDEHYHLRKNDAREMAVRLNFLDELLSNGSQSTDTDDPNHEGKSQVDVQEKKDVHDREKIEKMKEEIYKQSFRSYYESCKNLVTSEGSGACREGFESGFKFSTSRTSLLSLTVAALDVTLTAIEGGEAGMIEVVQKLDPVALEYNIPFARLYGCNLNLQAGSLGVQLRDYTYPLLAATSGKCEGRLVLAQQATPFQPQTLHEIYIGKWRKVEVYRSLSGTTPPMKTFLDLPLHFQKGEVAFGVGFEPVLADLSYAFTIALRRAKLSVRDPNPFIIPPKKEKSLPWWDEMRNYIHGKTILSFSETLFNILATPDPYEKSDKLQMASGYMEIQQSDGLINISSRDFKIYTTSLETLLRNSTIKPPAGAQGAFLFAPVFNIEVAMDWGCDSGTPLNHYLFALPSEGAPREFLFDPFRSTSLSVRFNLVLRPSPPSENQPQPSNASFDLPTISAGAHDFAWLIKFGNLNYLPPLKLRFFSRYPRFGAPRVPRSGNLSLDKVMTEFMARVDITPTCIRHMSLDENDPAKGLTFNMSKIKIESYLGRGKQKFTFDSKRDLLDLVYQGIDLYMPKVFINKDDCTSVIKVVQTSKKNDKSNAGGATERYRDDGFLLSSDYFIIRKQSPKADSSKLVAWQEAGKKSAELTRVKTEYKNGSDSDERSDPSDDDGYNVVIDDNCQRVFVYGLKIHWNIENRNAMWSWSGELGKAFASPKPSPSRQYARRKLLEETQMQNKSESVKEDGTKSTPTGQGESSSPKQKEASGSDQSPSSSSKVEPKTFEDFAKHLNFDESKEEEGTRHLMVNVIEPQFNLHSEEANGRFLLAAASGRVLARSFHKVINVGIEAIEQAVGKENENSSENQPELIWNRAELSVMLERVQAHVAPTDVDPGAGIQWLPRIRKSKSSPKIKRTGALLEQVFMPCDMFFRYTRHKGGTTDLKVKPLKELAFNSHNIAATMTSRQFQVMLDVLTNLLLARPPKVRKSSLPKSAEDDEDMEEEADEVVPDGVEEVELERINLEQKERIQNLLYDDIRKLTLSTDTSAVDVSAEKEGDMWIVTAGRSTLAQKLRKELVNAQKSRKAAAASLRVVLQRVAQQRLMDKEKNKGPSCAMRISLQINKVVWSMLMDGKSISEVDITDMIYDFDRDYKDIGVARFTMRCCVIKNCLPNAKSDTLLSAWNPPSEWGKKVMIRVDAKQGAPKDGVSPLELLQVDVYPLKIHLTETMYRMMWGYFFPEEEQDSHHRQEVWKVSTKDLRKAKKGNEGTKDSEGTSKTHSVDPFAKNAKPSSPKLRRTSSFDQSWEESVAESVANELLQEMSLEQEELSKPKTKDSKASKTAKNAKTAKTTHSAQEEKKLAKPTDDKKKVTEEKKSKSKPLREFHNIKISQVELLVTYEGSRFAVCDMRLLMDSFHRVEYIGTWKKLFARVKKHVIWGVLKSVTGMQGKKFKDKLHGQSKEPNVSNVPTLDSNDSDENLTLAFPKRPADGAGDGFVTSVKGLFHTQKRKAKAFVLRTMRNEGEEPMPGEWSENEDYSPFARQLTVTKAKKLIRRHTKKFNFKKGLSEDELDLGASDSDSSSDSDPFEEYLEYKAAQEKAAEENAAKEKSPSTP